MPVRYYKNRPILACAGALKAWASVCAWFTLSRPFSPHQYNIGPVIFRLSFQSPVTRGHFRLGYGGALSGCMDVNSPQSAAGGFSVKSRLEELQEVRFPLVRPTSMRR